MRSHSTYLGFLILLAVSNNDIFCLDSNEYRSPQVISDTYDLCAGRSSECEVELDVPVACVDTATSTSISPIVFFLHGAGGSNEGFKLNSGVHENKMIGIYPSSDCKGWNIGLNKCNNCEWDDFDCTEDHNEGEFIAKIISKVRELGALGNVYVLGNPNGAALALRLAVNAGEHLPITGIVAAVTQLLESPERSGPGELNFNQPISSNPPVSILSISGTADGLLPYEGETYPVFGGNENFYFMSNEESNNAWAVHNECDLNPEIQTVSASLGPETTTADYFQYQNCLEGTHAEYYMVYSAGHNAGGESLDGKNSKEIVYNFIRKVEEEIGVNPPTSSPIASPPTPNTFVSECEDVQTSHGKYNEAHSYGFVANKPNVRCNWENDEGFSEMNAFPVSCDYCNNEPPSSPPVASPPSATPFVSEFKDDKTWHAFNGWDSFRLKNHAPTRALKRR